jgi:chitinase
VVGPPAGTLSINFTSINSARITYTINGVSGTKNIQRQSFGTPDYRYAAVHDVSNASVYAYPRMVGDMWWGGTAESGWGVSVAQQYRTLFSVWYTYGLDAKPTWYVMPGGVWQDNRYISDLYSTTAAGWLGVAFNPASVVSTRVGSAEFNFTSNAAATYNYSFTGGSFLGTEQTKPLQRQAY